MEGDKGVVCVTGGIGFVASWMIKMLLEQGYSVITTIRPDSGNKRDISFLTNLPGAEEKLKIFRADLNDPHSFDAVIEGCKGVIHAATPLDLQEPEALMTKRTIDGALGILKACLKSKTVKKIVYTSSSFAVLFNKYQDVVEMMDESFWTDIDYVRETKSFASNYSISKTLAERAALKFAEEHGLELVTIAASLVVGPFICPKFPGSVQCLLAPILPGNQNQNELMGLLANVSMAHVDDLSRAHIFLLEHPTARGRSLANVKGPKLPGLSSKKLLDTGFKFKYGDEDMYDEAIKCCKEKGFL